MRHVLHKFIAIVALGIAAGMAEPNAARAGSDGRLIASGEFNGKNGHKASGRVVVIATANGVEVVLRDDFKFDGAPDPKLGFGKGGYFKSTEFSALASNTGGQRYRIPSRINAAGYTEIWIWCKKYAVPLALAVLKPAR
jgi:Electron transfer DM13